MAQYLVKLYFKPLGGEEFSPLNSSIKHFVLHPIAVKELPKVMINSVRVIDKTNEPLFNQDIVNAGNYPTAIIYTNQTYITIDTEEPEIYDNLGLIWRSCGCQSGVIIYMYSLHLKI
jgi:hypothetical protein